MNPLLIDPTRTVTLRRSFVKGLNRAFRRLRYVVSQLVVVEDAFGLVSQRIPSRPVGNDATAASDRPVSNKRWAYKSNEEAAEQFEKWLKAEVRKELMSEAEALRWRRYIQRGFEVGANRALVDVRRGRGKGAKATRFLDPSRVESGDFKEGQREAFLRTTLSKSTATEKLRLLQSTALSEVRGLGDTIVTNGRRVLVDSLIRNLSPRETAQRLEKVLKVSAGRARVIANTELVRSHAEGQLEAMETLGVEKVGVAVEWSSLASACPLCKPLDGIVLTVKEARGMLPRHPSCRCAWTVANVAESPEEKKQQKRSKTKIDKAVSQSQKREGDNEWGPGREIARERPKGTLNSTVPVRQEHCRCHPEVERFSVLMTELGLL